ncbi:MAG: peptidylprolyl isomerase [Verrucomicrobiae bacterium]|nr:peptidylprolyl isomerase [Verrucomicrobiae bacterium]MCB1088701.1 peptidylprolyl isomerase [Verrucomicrobiae bacterium]
MTPLRFLLLPLLCLTLANPRLSDAQDAAPAISDVHATISTDKGDIKVVIYASKTPVTAANFLNLAKRGYYDGVKFHRVVEDFVIQGGDPSGTGRGGPGYFIENEIVPELKHDAIGVLSMARKKEPDTNGSQFFITLDATPHLDGGYSVFGKVVEGIDVVEKIEVGDIIKHIEVTDSTDPLFTKMETRLEEWNRILDERDKAEKEAGEKP